MNTGLIQSGDAKILVYQTELGGILVNIFSVESEVLKSLAGVLSELKFKVEGPFKSPSGTYGLAIYGQRVEDWK